MASSSSSGMDGRRKPRSRRSELPLPTPTKEEMVAGSDVEDDYDAVSIQSGEPGTDL